MIGSLLRNAGVRHTRISSALAGWWRYCRDRREFRRQSGPAGLLWGTELLILTKWTVALSCLHTAACGFKCSQTTLLSHNSTFIFSLPLRIEFHALNLVLTRRVPWRHLTPLH